jgi:hypothetical protein
VKRLIGMAMVLTTMFGSLPAFAQFRPEHGRRDAERTAPGRQAAPPQRGPERPRDPGPEGREAPQQGRLSDEERRQLRRDINEHGRDIYRERSGQRR